MSAMPAPNSFTLVAAPAPARRGADALPALSPLEWKVVRLALDEAFRGRRTSAKGPSPVARGFARIGRALFGLEGVPPLASPRLETLRRFVNTSRRGHRDAVALAKRLIEQGFSAAQVRAVERLVGR